MLVSICDVADRHGNRHMKQDQAKPLIFKEFRSWAWDKKIENPTPFDALGFYEDLVARDSDLLGFRCSGDRWQVIKG